MGYICVQYFGYLSVDTKGFESQIVSRLDGLCCAFYDYDTHGCVQADLVSYEKVYDIWIGYMVRLKTFTLLGLNRLASPTLPEKGHTFMEGFLIWTIKQNDCNSRGLCFKRNNFYLINDSDKWTDFHGQCTREIGVDAGGQAETQPGTACEYRTEDHVV